MGEGSKAVLKNGGAVEESIPIKLKNPDLVVKQEYELIRELKNAPQQFYYYPDENVSSDVVFNALKKVLEILNFKFLHGEPTPKDEDALLVLFFNEGENYSHPAFVLIVLREQQIQISSLGAVASEYPYSGHSNDFSRDLVVSLRNALEDQR